MAVKSTAVIGYEIYPPCFFTDQGHVCSLGIPADPQRGCLDPPQWEGTHSGHLGKQEAAVPGSGGPVGQCLGRGKGYEQNPANCLGKAKSTAPGGKIYPPAPEGPPRPAGVRRRAGRADRPPPALLRSAPLPASLRRRGRGRAAGRSPRREVVMVSRVTCVRGSPARGEEAAGAGRLQSRTGPPRQVWGEAE